MKSWLPRVTLSTEQAQHFLVNQLEIFYLLLLVNLCTQMYRFSAGTWVSFQSISIFIFILVVIGTINSQYYEADDRRKIAANLMDLEGIVPIDNEHDNIDFAHESNNKDSSFTWSRGRSIGSKSESKRVDDSDDDLY